MSTVKLKYQGVQTIANCPSIGLIILTDLEEKRQVSIVCDSYTRLQYAIRTKQINPDNIRFHIEQENDEDIFSENYGENEMSPDDDLAKVNENSSTGSMLPEVLCGIINYMTNLRLGVNIVNIFDGEYRSVIVDYTSGTSFPVRVTDGILLTLANKHVPLTMDERMWNAQSMPFQKDGKGVQLPINSLTMPMLKNALQNAIDDERYEAAQALKEEIQRRKK